MLKKNNINSKSILSIQFETAVHLNKTLQGTSFKLFEYNPNVSVDYSITFA